MNELELLKKQVKELMDWKNQREKQQLTFPIDLRSRNILNEDVLTTTGDEVAPVSLLLADTALEVNINGTLYWVLASPAP